MALNVSVFKTRALTALLFVIIMLTGIFINEYVFTLLFYAILLGCLWEAAKLLLIFIYKNENIYFKYNALLQMAVLGTIPIILLLINKMFSDTYLLAILITLALFSLYIIFVQKQNIKDVKAKNQADRKNVIFIQAYTLLLPFSFFCLISIRYYFGVELACLVIFSMWINDTMAYLVGSFIGKNPLSKISPKKTWEGTIGGVILCAIIMGFGMPLIFKINFPQYHLFVIAGICGIVGTLGDLAESKIKRLANVKDSGSFMPGHGGFLDRFDSIIFGAIFVFLYAGIFLKQYI